MPYDTAFNLSDLPLYLLGIWWLPSHDLSFRQLDNKFEYMKPSRTLLTLDEAADTLEITLFDLLDCA